MMVRHLSMQKLGFKLFHLFDLRGTGKKIKGSDSKSTEIFEVKLQNS